MLEQLFGSKTRFKLLKFLFREPEQAFFVRELSRALDSHIHAVRRELDLLVSMHILVGIDKPEEETEKKKKTKSSTTKKAGASLRKYYMLNKQSPIYGELQALLLKSQVLGEQKFTQEILETVGELQLFIITGRFTGDSHLQTDMLLVGKVKVKILEKIIKKYEKDFGFDIRYTIMTENEFNDRRYIMDKFLYSIFESKNITILNNFDITL